MVLGVGLFVSSFVGAVGSATQTDGTLPANGTPTTITTPANADRTLFRSSNADPVCRIIDGSGARIPIGDLGGTATVTANGRTWEGFGRIRDTGDGRLTVSCVSSDAGAQVRIGASLGAGFIAGIGMGLLGAFGFGFGGFVTLVVVAVLWLKRAPRP